MSAFYSNGGAEKPAAQLKQYEDLSHAELVAQLLASHETIRNLEARTEEILRESRTDDLTGVLSRKGLREEYERAGKRYHRHGEPGRPDLLAIVDLDKFKTINDTKGHATGNNSLKDIAGILDQSTRGSDIVGRYGGDEFIVFLYGATIEEGAKIMERARFNAETFHRGKHPSIHIPTLSIGLAEIDYSLPFDEAIRLADSSMYKAKQTGGNRVYSLAETRSFDLNGQ